MKQQTITVAITMTYDEETWSGITWRFQELADHLYRLNDDLPYLSPEEAIAIDHVVLINEGPAVEVKQ